MPTDDDTGALASVRFLARAESRVRVMEHLAESGSATQRDLRTALDASRTTISRSLRSLEDRDWVVAGDDGAYRLTRTGSIVVDEFTDLLDAIRTTDDLAEFLRWFPADEPTPDFLDVGNVEVTTSTEGNPYAPARKQAEILHQADSLRILLPSIDLDATETIAEQVTERGLDVETVVSPGLEPTLESEAFAPLLREKLATGGSTVLVADAALPFYLGLAGDGRVQIGVEDDEGFPRSLLETSDERVHEWAEDVYEDHREPARRKSVEEFR